MTEVVAAEPEKSVKRMGWALLALALATPALLGAAGILSAYKVGELTAQIGFAWLFAALAIDLVLKRRDVISKARGRIVAAALTLVMSLVSGFNVYRDTQKVDTAKRELIESFMATTVEARNAPLLAATPEQVGTAQAPAASPAPVAPNPVNKPFVANEADRMVGFMNAMKVRAKAFAEQSAALDRKFNAVDMGTVLTPQALTSKDGIQASRKTLDYFKGLINERDKMLKQHFISTEQVIRSQGLTDREVNEAIAGMRGPQDESVKVYAALSAAQLASLKATSDIVNFAERSLGRVVVQNAQMMFQTQPELDEYNRLMQVLTVMATKEEAVTQQVATLSQKRKQSLVDQLK
ncbi:MAG: hypothetical protein RL682_189 [Pseudomonadota bacterium]